MKKSNKKGFTIVELVIVIAVIGILAAVLIPTFSSVVDKANASAAFQEAKNEYTLYVSENAQTLTGDEDFVIVVDNEYYVLVTDGQLADAAVKGTKPTGYGNVDASKYYAKTADTTVVSGKTYYTYANSVYTAVTTPDVANIATYYEQFDLGNDGVAIYAKTVTP